MGSFYYLYRPFFLCSFAFLLKGFCKNNKVFSNDVREKSNDNKGPKNAFWNAWGIDKASPNMPSFHSIRVLMGVHGIFF